jgi:hypothetical protein
MATTEPSQLLLTPNIADPDDFYDELLQAHGELSKEQSDDFNARLILLLCNHIGDRHIIREALQAAQMPSGEESIQEQDKE